MNIFGGKIIVLEDMQRTWEFFIKSFYSEDFIIECMADIYGVDLDIPSRNPWSGHPLSYKISFREKKDCNILSLPVAEIATNSLPSNKFVNEILNNDRVKSFPGEIKLRIKIHGKYHQTNDHVWVNVTFSGPIVQIDQILLEEKLLSLYHSARDELDLPF